MVEPAAGPKPYNLRSRSNSKVNAEEGKGDDEEIIVAF